MFDGHIIGDSTVNIYFPPRHKPGQGQDTTARGVVLYVEDIASGRTHTFARTRSTEDRQKYDRWTGLGYHGPVSFAGNRVEDMAAWFGSAGVKLRAEVDYLDGTVLRSRVYEFAQVDAGKLLPAGRRAVEFTGPINSIITFLGDEAVSNRGSKALLREPAPRGSRWLKLNNGFSGLDPALAPGQVLQLSAMPTKEFAQEIGRAPLLAPILRELAMVKTVRAVDDGLDVELVVPTRTAFEVGKGSREQPDHVTVRYPISGAGIKNLELHQENRIWFNGIDLQRATHSWIRNVKVVGVGRNPVFAGGLNNEIRDSEFLDPRWSADTSGASGYVGFFGGVNCLMDNVYTRRCRHAPNFSGGVGSVIRGGQFVLSDAQWHASYGREHLLENVTVDATQVTGSYGWGLYVMQYNDPGNGPGGGPRNVVYGCELRAPQGGAYPGGANSGWMLLWNRFTAAAGPSVAIREHTRDALIMGNVFAQQHRFTSNVVLGEARRGAPISPEDISSISGVRLLENTFHGGNGQLLSLHDRDGQVPESSVASHGNRILPYEALPAPPTPPLPSLFLAQVEQPAGHPAAPAHNPSKKPDLGDQRLVRQPTIRINFEHNHPAQERASNPADWLGDDPESWLRDNAEPFGPRTDAQGRQFEYGWTAGKPQPFRRAHGSDRDWRYYRGVEFDKESVWEMKLVPGRHKIFVALGDSREPELRSATGYQYHPFISIEINGKIHKEPVPAPMPGDRRRHAVETEVTVGADGRLLLKAGPEAEQLKIAFMEIEPLPDSQGSSPSPQPVISCGSPVIRGLMRRREEEKGFRYKGSPRGGRFLLSEILGITSARRDFWDPSA